MIATDLSETAIRQAAAKANHKGLQISFRQDDILNSRLEQSFDLILDRGCFHVLPPQSRSTYVQTVANLLKPNGYLLLKCFSDLETREQSLGGDCDLGSVYSLGAIYFGGYIFESI